MELKITLTQGKGVSVEGPVQDKMLCYALLEMARDIVKDFKMEDQPVIQVVEKSL